MKTAGSPITTGAVILVGQEGNIPRVRDREQAMVRIMRVLGDAPGQIGDTRQAPLGIVRIAHRPPERVCNQVNPQIGAGVAESELASSWFGEGGDPALRISSDEDCIAIPIALAHPDAIAYPEPPAAPIPPVAWMPSIPQAQEQETSEEK